MSQNVTTTVARPACDSRAAGIPEQIANSRNDPASRARWIAFLTGSPESRDDHPALASPWTGLVSWLPTNTLPGIDKRRPETGLSRPAAASEHQELCGLRCSLLHHSLLCAQEFPVLHRVKRISSAWESPEFCDLAEHLDAIGYPKRLRFRQLTGNNRE